MSTRISYISASEANDFGWGPNTKRLCVKWFMGVASHVIAQMAVKRMGRLVVLLGTLLGALGSIEKAKAAELLGSLELSDFLIEATYSRTETNRGGFSLETTYLAVDWKRDPQLKARLKLGTADLLGSPARFGPPSAEKWTLAEAFVESNTSFGRVRAGLLPIPFGLEGGDSEARRRLPRSLLFQSRYVGLRDFGVGYRIESQGFFNDWMIHNGESGRELDNEAWLTARWGWHGGDFFRLGVSASAGRTSSESTNPEGVSNSALAGLDVDQPSRVRIANAFLVWEVDQVVVEIESTTGETRQDVEPKSRRLWASRADLTWELGPRFATLFRYDTLDPQAEAGGDRITEWSAALAWRTRYENSAFYMVGTKRIEENVSPDAHKLMLIWRMTPSATSFRSAL